MRAMTDDDRRSRFRRRPRKAFCIASVLSKATFLSVWNHTGIIAFASGMHRHHHRIVVSFGIADFSHSRIPVAQIRNPAEAGKPEKSNAHVANLQHGDFTIDPAGRFDPSLGQRRIGGYHAALSHIFGMIIGHRNNFHADLCQ